MGALFRALSSLNTALLTEVEQHYHDPTKPYPGIATGKRRERERERERERGMYVSERVCLRVLVMA